MHHSNASSLDMVHSLAQNASAFLLVEALPSSLWRKLLGMPTPTLQHATSPASCLPGPACCHKGTWQLCHSQTATQIWRAPPPQAAYFYVSCKGLHEHSDNEWSAPCWVMCKEQRNIDKIELLYSVYYCHDDRAFNFPLSTEGDDTVFIVSYGLHINFQNVLKLSCNEYFYPFVACNNIEVWWVLHII